MNEAKMQRVINRERLARKEAERLLESKSHELYETNQNLEKLVEQRTQHLNEALQEIQSAMEIRSRFLSNMSHEIRTPLNAIIGFVELILHNDLPQENVLRYLTIIYESSQSLLQIINDILDLSKLESGKFTISKKNINLQQKLTSLYELFAEEAQKKSLTYCINFSDNFPTSLYLDETRMSQIVLNFLSNAMKFTPEGKSILIEVEYEEQSYLLTLKIIDTGIGIEQEKQDSIFNSFEQADGSITRQFGGTGLGLAIAKQLIEFMDGTVIFHSKKDVGSTFGFTMPMQTFQENAPLEQTVTLSKKRFSHHHKVLVAEDNETNIILIETLLEQFGVTFDVVKDGEEAIKAVQKNLYDLVLMDNQMPKLSGIEATKAIRKFNQTLPIVALSANALKEEQKAFLEAGMNGTLTKPIDHEKLKMMLQKYLH
jgi:signal transduction histidine kinase